MNTIPQNLINLEEARKLTPYTADYLGQLIRKGRLQAWKEKGKWRTTPEAVEKYMLKVAEENFEHQKKLAEKIPALWMRFVPFSLKRALVLLGFIFIAAGIFGLYAFFGSRESGVCGSYEIANDNQGNEVVRVCGKEYVRNILAGAKSAFSGLQF